MSILLTGAAGYIGSHSAVAALEAGYDCVIADNLSNSSAEAVRRVEELTGKSVRFYEVNLCDAGALRPIFEENRIDAVLHFAGYKAVGESVQKPLMYYRNNLDSTLTLLETMDEFACRKIIFSSSATVYGTPETLPLTEDCPTGGCSNPYGFTKFMIEQILRDWSSQGDGRCAVLLRYFNPVGAHPSGRIGEAPNGIPNNLMPFITQVAVGRREKLSIFGNDYPTPDGTGVRDYIHVCDLAAGHVAALRFTENHAGAEVFNLGTGRGLSVLELAQTFERVNHVKIPYVFAPRRDGDIAACWADPTKAQHVLHWKAVLGAEEMCRDSWNWQKNNPNGYDT